MRTKTSHKSNRTNGVLSFQQKSHPLGNQKPFPVLEWLLLLCPFLFGCFFPWASALVSLVLITLLILLIRRGLLCCTYSAPFLAAASIVLFHLGGIFWGTDHGMAPVGAVQFLPLPLFILLIEQYTPEQRLSLLRRMPYTASMMVVLSVLLSRFPLLEGWFLVAGRQSGFFQYPNTYAIYLLFALVLVLFSSPLRFGQLPWLILLTLGILLSGSRIVFFLLLAVFLVFLFREKSGKARLGVLIIAALTIFMFIYLKYTKHGYEIDVVGESEKTARYIGINVRNVIMRTMLLSGAICGVCGWLLVGSTNHTLTTSLTSGYGFTAVMVSWLSRFDPLIMIFSSFLLIFMNKGASEVASSLSLNESYGDILTGIVLFFLIGCEFFINYRVIFRKKNAEVSEKKEA